MVNPGTRLIWLDALRLCAGLSMVGLHASADPAGQPWAAYVEVERIAPMLLRAVLYVARTELFLIISVFLLILALEKRPRSYGQVICQQSRRLLVPFTFWTLFYAFYSLNKAHAFGYAESAWAALASPREWPGFLLLGSIKYHMHFIPTLFGMLPLLPLYRTAARFPVLGLGLLPLLLIRRELDGVLYAELWGADILPYLARTVKILTYAGYGMAAAAFYTVWTRMGRRDLAQWAGPVLLAGGLMFAMKLAAAWKTVEAGQWPFSFGLLGRLSDAGAAFCALHVPGPPAMAAASVAAGAVFLRHLPLPSDLSRPRGNLVARYRLGSHLADSGQDRLCPSGHGVAGLADLQNSCAGLDHRVRGSAAPAPAAALAIRLMTTCKTTFEYRVKR